MPRGAGGRARRRVLRALLRAKHAGNYTVRATFHRVAQGGRQVTAYDSATGTASVQTVQQTHLNHDSNLLAVTLRTVTPTPATRSSDSSASKQREAMAAHGAHAPPSRTTRANLTADETIQTTTNHPWLSADHGWILASFLRLGEPVQRVDGSIAVQVAISTGARLRWGPRCRGARGCEQTYTASDNRRQRKRAPYGIIARTYVPSRRYKPWTPG